MAMTGHYQVPVHTAYCAWRKPKPLWKILWRETPFACATNWTLDRPSYSLVTVLTTLAWLPFLGTGYSLL